MTRARWLRAITLILAVTACGWASATSADSGHGTLEIAGFQPFTGADATFGPELMAGCEPAALLVNRSGGVLGHHVKCVPVDTRGDPADAVPAAQQLLATASNLLGV